MAKKIIWSLQAQSDRRNILEFWVRHNRSSTYSIKLNRLFKASAKLIAKHPNIGRRTDFGNVRAKVLKDYLIFYEETKTTVNILTVWDTRQHPEKIKDRVK